MWNLVNIKPLRSHFFGFLRNAKEIFCAKNMNLQNFWFVVKPKIQNSTFKYSKGFDVRFFFKFTAAGLLNGFSKMDFTAKSIPKIDSKSAFFKA